MSLVNKQTGNFDTYDLGNVKRNTPEMHAAAARAMAASVAQEHNLPRRKTTARPTRSGNMSASYRKRLEQRVRAGTLPGVTFGGSLKSRVEYRPKTAGAGSMLINTGVQKLTGEKERKSTVQNTGRLFNLLKGWIKKKEPKDGEKPEPAPKPKSPTPEEVVAPELISELKKIEETPLVLPPEALVDPLPVDLPPELPQEIKKIEEIPVPPS